MSPIQQTHKANPELLRSLAGLSADRDRKASARARRVVLGSAGVLNEQKLARRRIRAVALAAGLITLFFIAPLAWRCSDMLAAGESVADQAGQASMWAAILCCTLVAAMLVVGWRKRKNR